VKPKSNKERMEDAALKEVLDSVTSVAIVPLQTCLIVL